VDTAQAQWRRPIGYNHASTAAEGYLSGRARLRASSGYFLESLGRYELLHQDAYSKYLDNKLKRTQTYWDRKKVYAENNKRLTWPQREAQRLDMEMQRMDVLELRAQVAKRKQELIDKGVIAQKPFWIRGEKFNSREEYQKSDLRQRVIAEGEWRTRTRELEKIMAEERHKKAVEFGRMWSKMSWLEKERYKKLDATQRAEYKRRRNDPNWYKIHQARKFYELRPYLLPSAGKGGLPPNPYK
tara:strand:+ start:1050 stop:1775 length:726 start_codon:yes stop_codon:yes gene_type:complete